jgi:glycosyltransferase involved in cell wall biosynthesis
LKIAVFCDAFLPADHEGGPPFSTASLCRGLAHVGADVRVITTDRNGPGRIDVPTDRWTPYDGIRVWYARSLPGPYYLAPSARRAVQSLDRLDCLIASGTLWTHLGLLAWRTGQREDVPNVMFPRGLLDPWALAFKATRKRVYWGLVGRRILRDAAVVVTLSDSEREAVRSLGVAQRLEAIPNGVNVEDFVEPQSRSVLDDWLPALRGRPYVLFLGRIHEKKGLPALVDALHDPALAGLDLRLVIAGPVDEEYRPRWQALVASGGSRLVVTGPVSGHNKAALLQHAAAFVLPSQSEGLPVAVLEALASACPTILTARCHLPEVAQLGAGIEVEPCPSQIAAAIARLLADEGLRRAIGQRGRALARERFDARVIGERTLALCRDVARPR